MLVECVVLLSSEPTLITIELEERVMLGAREVIEEEEIQEVDSAAEYKSLALLLGYPTLSPRTVMLTEPVTAVFVVTILDKEGTI